VKKLLAVFALLACIGCNGGSRIVLTGDDKVYLVTVEGKTMTLKREGEEYIFTLDREMPFEWGERRWILSDARLHKLMKAARLNAPED